MIHTKSLVFMSDEDIHLWKIRKKGGLKVFFRVKKKWSKIVSSFKKGGANFFWRRGVKTFLVFLHETWPKRLKFLVWFLLSFPFPGTSFDLISRGTVIVQYLSGFLFPLED